MPRSWHASQKQAKRPSVLDSSRGGNKTFSSVGLTFLRQMTTMVAELNSTRCNFVRCIKPNYEMSPGLFDMRYSVTKLRHTGMLIKCIIKADSACDRI